MRWPQNTHVAFKQMGHQADLFLFNKLTPLYCLAWLGGKAFRMRWLTNVLRHKIKHFKPDLILFVSAFFMPQAFFNLLDEFPCPIKAGWVGDRFAPPADVMANHLDYLFCSDSGYLPDTLNFKCKSFYLPLCASEALSLKQAKTKTLPPFFAAMANPLRTEYLKQCQTPCLIYGAGWNKKVLPQHYIYNHKISLAKATNLMARSIAPINIGFSRNVVCGLNFRVFEAGCLGALIMVNADSSDISKCYQLGREAVTYDSPKALNLLLQDIVRHPKKYQKIAKAGHKRTLLNHTYCKRMEQMLDMIKRA